MRFTFLFVSAACLMLASACADDTKTPQDMTPAVDTQPTPDVAKPDTQKPDLQVPDKVPHFDFKVPTCKFEVNLASLVPCMCGTTLVYDTQAQYPECRAPQVVKCCPLDGKPKCE
jgi:hypothetical protein